MKLKRALLVVDVQNDFCPGGALGIPGGDEIIPVLNKCLKIFSDRKLPVFVSRDWHPKNTKHFKPFGGTWPVHCVQNTKGAAFHPKLKLPEDAIFLFKGMDPDKDSYSCFQAHDSNNTGFLNLLKIFGVEELFIGGLATDYCVKYTTVDAIRTGFKVNILMDGIKGVNLRPRDSEEAIKDMVSEGASRVTIDEIEKILG